MQQSIDKELLNIEDIQSEQQEVMQQLEVQRNNRQELLVSLTGQIEKQCLDSQIETQFDTQFHAIIRVLSYARTSRLIDPSEENKIAVSINKAQVSAPYYTI